MKNFLSKIFNKKVAFIVFCIFIGLILLAIGFVKYLLWSMKPTIYNDPKDYKILKEKIVQQDKIKHFPNEIPADATDIHFRSYTQMPYDGEMLLLNFKTNKAFIENELKKNDFWNKNDKIGQKQKIYFVPKVTDDFDENAYTYYVINMKDNERYYKEYFPGRNWIGVDMKSNRILYFHSYPAD